MLKSTDPELRFDAEAHVYTLSGRRMPSVTQVLAQLEDWTKVDPVALDLARVRGQHIHRMVELDVHGNLDEDTLAPEYHGYLRQWRKFLAETRFKPLLAECQVFDERYGYAGTFDLAGTLGPRFILVDVKSGLVPRTVSLQTAAYLGAAVQRRRFPASAERAALRLHEDTYRFFPIDSSYDSDLGDFLAALRLFHWRERNT
jgi:hypothetical protein